MTITEERKAKLIEEHRDINVEHVGWWDGVYDDFKLICDILGIELDNREPSFSGFWCQGDGASFTGTYRAQGLGYAGLVPTFTYDTAPAEIREYCDDEELHRIADELCVLGRLYFPAFAYIRRSRGGNYVHSNTMTLDSVEPYDSDSEDWAQEVHDHVETTLLQLFRDLADWLYKTLDREYEYLTGDEAVWDAIVANELYKIEEEDEECED